MFRFVQNLVGNIRNLTNCFVQDEVGSLQCNRKLPVVVELRQAVGGHEETLAIFFHTGRWTLAVTCQQPFGMRL